jgi:3-hydroxybutyryl-CoA dehydrogenase
MFTRLGVVGCGQMGAGIAADAARRGLEVAVVEIPAALEAARSHLDRSLARLAASETTTREESEATRERISLTTDLSALEHESFVIEAVPEVKEIKFSVLRHLDDVMRSPERVIASNTSSFSIIDLGRATSKPERVVGLHFFNPVHAMRLVEVTPSLDTEPDVIRRAEALAGLLGKQPVRAQDRAGFIVNAILFPYILSAIRMVESGSATADDVDKAMVLGCGVPMGPLALADFVGLDTTLSIAEALYAEHRERQFAPPPLLARMVSAGRYGRKTGRGFFEYAS